MMEELLAAYPELQLQGAKGTVVCSLSRHEMPCRLEVVQAYVEGRKFKTLKAAKDFDFQRLEPYIIPSQRRRRQLFCTLTNRYMNREPVEVELHLKGKRYKRALEKYNAGEMVLFEEKTGKKKKAQAVREEVDDGLEEDMEVKEEGEGEGEGSRDEPVLVRVEEETDKHKLASQQTSRVSNGRKRLRGHKATPHSTSPTKRMKPSKRKSVKLS